MGNIKPVVFFAGESGQGKTTLCLALKKTIADSVVIHCDLSYLDFALKNKLTYDGGDLRSHVAPHYCGVSESVRQAFKEWLLNEIKGSIGDKTLFVEGWHLLFYCDDYIRFLRDAGIPWIKFSLARYQVFHYNKRIGPNDSNDTLQLISKMADYEHKRVTCVSSLSVDKLLAGTTYQHYAELGQGASNSRSLEKLLALRLPEDMGGGNVLDVGCNTGYHSIKMGQRGVYVDGIDIDCEALLLAEQYAKSVFSLPNVRFYHDDIFTCSLPYRYDWITCLSVFHYFREKQQLFFDLCHAMLEPGGKLLVETGIVSENPEDSSYVRLYRRGVDSKPCWFPNHATIKKMGAAFREVEHIGNSPQQPGDDIPRCIYKFIK